MVQILAAENMVLEIWGRGSWFDSFK